MDCDCELLHNELPFIPVYLFFSHITGLLRSAHTHTHYACICSGMQVNEKKRTYRMSV